MRGLGLGIVLSLGVWVGDGISLLFGLVGLRVFGLVLFAFVWLFVVSLLCSCGDFGWWWYGFVDFNDVYFVLFCLLIGLGVV